jgi:peptidoglycan/LPS O-acetylase OafA/YrhL
MTAPKTAEPASPWVVIPDFSKNVVTLAAALIGLTVTFASQLLGRADAHTKLSLYFAWGAAVFAIGFGVAAHGLVVRYLKSGTGENGAVLFANLAFIALGAAAVCFVIFGYLAVSQPAPTTVTAVAATESAVASAPGLSGDKNSKWLLRSLHYNPAQSSFNIVVKKENSAEELNVIIDSAGKVSDVQRP